MNIENFLQSTLPDAQCARHALTGVLIASLTIGLLWLSSRPENGQDIDGLRRTIQWMCMLMPVIGGIIGSLVGLLFSFAAKWLR
jgi:hypothetical protein